MNIAVSRRPFTILENAVILTRSFSPCSYRQHYNCLIRSAHQNRRRADKCMIESIYFMAELMGLGDAEYVAARAARVFFSSLRCCSAQWHRERTITNETSSIDYKRLSKFKLLVLCGCACINKDQWRDMQIFSQIINAGMTSWPSWKDHDFPQRCAKFDPSNVSTFSVGFLNVILLKCTNVFD